MFLSQLFIFVPAVKLVWIYSFQGQPNWFADWIQYVLYSFPIIQFFQSIFGANLFIIEGLRNCSADWIFNIKLLNASARGGSFTSTLDVGGGKCDDDYYYGDDDDDEVAV